MLTVENLSYSYDGKSHIDFPDFEAGTRETILVLGQSGTGKTTLLHLLGGILSPQKGEVKVNNSVLTSLQGAELDTFRARNIGIVFQAAHFIRSLNVTENLEFVNNLSNNQADKEFLNHLLEKVGLENRRKHFTQKLSQGEKQRLNILRAVVTKPKLILADEPTSALDDKNCDKVLDLLTSLSNEVNGTLVIVTHDNRLKDRFDKKIVLS